MKTLFSWVSWFIITGGTTSYWFFKIAPGTTGSFFAMIGLWVCYMEGLWSANFFILGFIISYLAGVIFIPAGERLMFSMWGKGDKFGEDKQVDHDYGVTVIDEINGMFIGTTSIYLAMQWHWLPTLSNGRMFLVLFVVFVIFRFFDISKILGIDKVEKFYIEAAKKVKSNMKSSMISHGIILDDTLGGIYTLIVSLVLFFIHAFLYSFYNVLY